jgi:DNA polymerase III delta prime subunit
MKAVQALLGTLLPKIQPGKHHAWLVSAPSAISADAAALHVAQQLSPHDELTDLIQPSENGSITIATIRELYAATSRKKDSRRAQQQVVVVQQAHTMTLQAQNALLKLLEEPTERVNFVLSTHKPSQLLPTVKSRCAPIALGRLNKDSFMARLEGSDPSEAEKRYHATQGDLVAALIGGDDDVSQVQAAKELITLPLGQALLEAQVYTKSRDQTLLILEALFTTLRAAQNAATDPAKRLLWAERAQVVAKAIERMGRNANARLVMSTTVAKVNARRVATGPTG